MGAQRVLSVFGPLLATVSLGVVPAAAATAEPRLTIHSLAMPTRFSAADNVACGTTCNAYQVTVTNAGSLPAQGPIAITDALPASLTVQGVTLDLLSGSKEQEVGSCESEAARVTCRSPSALAPDQTLQMDIFVTVQSGAVSGEPNTATAAEGSPPVLVAETTENDVVNSTPPPFGFRAFDALLAGLGGEPETQAGAHPYELATTINLNSVVRETPEGSIGVTSVHDLRDIVIDLPLGVAGSALPAPTCTLHQLSSRGEKGEQGESGCPEASIVGHIRTNSAGGLAVDSALYNLVPERGVFAEFGFIDATGGSHVLYSGIAPTSAGYVLRIESRELPQVALTEFTASIYGDPAARNGSTEAAAPTFTNPADCSGEPLKTVVHMDSWPAPGSRNPDGTPDFEDPNWVSDTSQSPPVTGCSQLSFQPTIAAHAESTQSDSPTGLEVDLKIPQSEGVEVLATPPVKNALLTLPEGMTIDPSAANGLQACSLAQVGMSASGVPNAAAPACPNASKLGTVQMETPALPAQACTEPGKDLTECPAESEREPTPLKGSIFLAEPHENPFGSPEHPGGSLLAIYIVIDSPRTGLILKLPAEVKADPTTGQLAIAIDDSPQFPFSQLRISFFGGSTALLRTPEACGAYAVSSALTPWSAPQSGAPATPSSSPFQITQAAGGGTCASTPPFAPSFAAGSVASQAGAYSPFSVRVFRQDPEQTLGSVSVTTPPGLPANLSSVPPCPEPQAQQGTCSQASRIGSATLAAGAGPNPLWLPDSGAPSDAIYLTGPYDGAPFGLSVVVPAIVGPFNLGQDGRPVVIRARIGVNTQTAQLQITTDPLPQILQGIPLQLRTLNITIDRSGFIFNPTDCNPLTVAATITSTQGTNANESSRFQAASCASLKFSPKLTALTRANGEFAGHGASLHVVIATPQGQANMRSLKVDLPQRLPARLETIQHACPERTFNASPATCPKTSVVGSAIVQTPILATAMTGQAILVSHGAAFPNLVLVLKAQGVTIDLTGALYVDTHNITSVTFRTIPDVPIRRLDLILPEGSRSILAASSGLCTKEPLTMLTAINGQNGVRVKPTVKVAVEGCKKKLTRAQKLTKALKACRKKAKGKRAACGRQARKEYGPVKRKQRKR
jgi:uncharacterized repeat protein (TIGR01451 family)